MIYLKLLAVLSLLGAMAWVVMEPGFEPGLAVIGSASALFGLIVVGKKNRALESQKQTLSNRSTGIQAGGDVNIGTSRRNEDV